MAYETKSKWMNESLYKMYILEKNVQKNLVNDFGNIAWRKTIIALDFLADTKI